MGIIILTSQGFSNQNIIDKFLSFIGEPSKKRIAIITTAARDKENNKWAIAAKDQFLQMGFAQVDFVDLETNPNVDFTPYDVVYVCGGNTFKLIKFCRQSDFKKSVQGLLGRNGIYIGLSASSLIMGPSINLANEVTPDINEDGVADFAGFNLVPQIIYPHYSPEVETSLVNFETKHEVKVERLTNDQALVISEGKIEKIDR